MEVAAELDMEDNSNHRPALNKLRHLPEVEEVHTAVGAHCNKMCRARSVSFDSSAPPH